MGGQLEFKAYRKRGSEVEERSKRNGKKTEEGKTSYSISLGFLEATLLKGVVRRQCRCP